MAWILWYALKRLLKPRFKSRDALLKWQQKKIARHLKRLSKKSAFVKQSIQQSTSITGWPTMDKRQMMQYFNQLNTAQLDREEAIALALAAEQSRNFAPTLKGLTVGLSSGTSGERGLFVVSLRERAQWVVYVLATLLPLKPKRQKVAFFLRANSNLYESVKSSFFNFKFFDIKNNIQSLITDLQFFQPDVLVAPASILLHLAQRREASMLQISPKRIISVAEVLEKPDEDYISKAFSLPVYQAYQCTEGFLASTCSEGSLHFHEDIIQVEKQYTDSSNTRFYPVVTDFERFTQPILRYLLNDLIVINPEPCSCGSIFLRISHIEGRADDVFEFENQKKLFPDTLRQFVYALNEAPQDYRLIQTSHRHIDVFVADTSEKALAAIQIAFRSFLNAHALSNVDFKLYNYLPTQDQDQKVRRIKRAIVSNPKASD